MRKYSGCAASNDVNRGIFTLSYQSLLSLTAELPWLRVALGKPGQTRMSPHPAHDTTNVSLLPMTGRRFISKESCPASRGWPIPSDTKLFEFLTLRMMLPKWFPLALLLQADVCPQVTAGHCPHRGALLMDLLSTSTISWLICGLQAASINWVCWGAPKRQCCKLGVSRIYWKATSLLAAAEPQGILLPNMASPTWPCPMAQLNTICSTGDWITRGVLNHARLRLGYSVSKVSCPHLQNLWYVLIIPQHKDGSSIRFPVKHLLRNDFYARKRHLQIHPKKQQIQVTKVLKQLVPY